MNETGAAAEVREQVLVQLLAELERSSDAAAVVDRYCQSHPELAYELREKAALMQSLDRLRKEQELPARLGENRIVRLIKQSGMGEVYEAIQEPLSRRVAVKVIRRDQLSPEAMARFLREQKVLASLHQTHIVPIHAAGQEGRLQYFVMPFIEGVTLDEVVSALQNPQAAGTAAGSLTLAELAARGRGGSSDALLSTQETLAKSALTPVSQEGPTPPASAPARAALSWKYFVSVAQAMVAVAEALHHAHEEGFLHRDLKPSNVMVDEAGQCCLIDFGLAASLNASDTSGDAADGLPEAGGEPRLTQGRLGTPQYMAPEQWTGQTLDARTDVWGLGATLYELLTLRRAFDGAGPPEIEHEVLTTEPVAMESAMTWVPRDLEAICRKALQKEPSRRYATALEFADDLRRWLRREPTVARPGQIARRVGLWFVRNKGWGTAIAASVMALVISAAAALWAAVAASAKERVERREKLLHQIQLVQLTQHSNGWSDRVWRLVAQAAELGDEDGRVRDEAAASLAGMDARRSKQFKDFDASAVAFDAEGKRLLIGGSDDARSGRPLGGARLWDSATDEVHVSKLPGAGPVAFRDGTPLQLVAREGPSLLLWDVAKQRQVSFCRFLPEQKVLPSWKIAVMALAADGALIAAAARGPDGEGLCAVWEADSGKQRFAFRGRIHALALSPDKALLAAGGDDGKIRVWSLAQGKELATPRSTRMTILALAFSPDSKLHVSGDGPATMTGRLAAGERGGNITLWELATRQPRFTCFGGSLEESQTLAFSPDGLTLVSGARLWDAATGRLLLVIDASHTRGLAFSPDGSKLAVAQLALFGFRGGVDVWELDNGRGIQTLRGLASPIVKVRFSPNGRLLAALAHNWQIAIWEIDSGRFVRVLQAPEGRYHDNAALAFSPDGRQIAFSAEDEAKLWAIATGKELRSWKLPLGLGDILAFHPSDKLLLFRVETKSMKRGPWSGIDGADFEKDPRVCRIRDLSVPGDPKLLAVIEDFDKYVYPCVATPDGSYFVLEGKEERGAPERRFFRGIDGLTGKQLWIVPSNNPHHAGSLHIDPTGKLAALGVVDGKEGSNLVEITSGRLVGTLDHGSFLGPEARLLLRGSAFVHALGRDQGQALYRRGEKTPLVHLDIRAARSSASVFSADGRLIAHGNLDGSVSVYNLPEIQGRLAALGLGW